jgi:hypothetical protein
MKLVQEEIIATADDILLKSKLSAASISSLVRLHYRAMTVILSGILSGNLSTVELGTDTRMPSEPVSRKSGIV